MSKKILIADDELNIVAAIEFLLQQSEREVHIAHNGLVALKQADGYIPDLALLDVMVPKENG